MATTSGEELVDTNIDDNTLHCLHRAIVIIEVGPDKYEFLIHKERLCRLSPYFRKALSDVYSEGEKDILVLDDVSVEVFKIFEEWAYYGRFNYERVGKKRPDLEDTVVGSTPSILLMQAFCFGDRFFLPKFQDLAVQAIHTRATKEHLLPAIDAVDYAYDNTADDSPLRRLLVDLYALNVNPHLLSIDLLDAPKVFLFDIFANSIGRQVTDTNIVSIQKQADDYYVSRQTANDFSALTERLHLDIHNYDLEEDPARQEGELIEEGSTAQLLPPTAPELMDDGWGSFTKKKSKRKKTTIYDFDKSLPPAEPPAGNKIRFV